MGKDKPGWWPWWPLWYTVEEVEKQLKEKREQWKISWAKLETKWKVYVALKKPKK